MTGNTIDLVLSVIKQFRDNEVELDLFGGWAEELLGLRTPGPHGDIDFLYRGNDFSPVDVVVGGNPDLFAEVLQKRFAHKRAFRHRDVLCEISLVQDSAGTPFTAFWGDVRYFWATPLLRPEPLRARGVQVSIASAENLAKYRSEFGMMQNYRWRDPASLVPPHSFP